MIMVPVALRRKGCFALRRSAFAPVALLLALSMSETRIAGAQTVKEILQKVEDVYNKASSYQCNLIVRRTGKGPDGKPLSITQTQQVQYKSPNLFRVQVSVTGTGAAAAAVKNGNSTVISDGKNIYVYMPSQKQYMKQAVPASLPLRQLMASVIPGANTANARLVAPSMINGRPVYVLEVKPQAPPNLTPEQKARFARLKPIQIMVDKQNYHVVRIHQEAADAQLDVSFNGQTVNGTVPSKAFVWTPPPGAKEFVRPATPAPGNATPGALPGTP